jgi:hypothetical protein
VIAQESLQAFINALSPGAYSSITRVNFKILDHLLLKPIGVYGSREEIVRFFREMGAVDVQTCVYPLNASQKAHIESIGRDNCLFRKTLTRRGELIPF